MELAVYNGSAFVDIMPYVAAIFPSFSRGYTEGGNSMTMQNGDYYPDRIRAKDAITINFRPVTAEEQALILSLLAPRGLLLRHTDRATAMTTTGYFYPGEIPSTYLVKRQNGVEYFGGLSVTLDPR